MDPMGRAIADYWNARSSESRQARLDGQVATSKDEVKTKKADRLRVFSPMFEEDEIPWLYIDADTLREQAAKNGYAVEVVAEGEHYDYLARITRK